MGDSTTNQFVNCAFLGQIVCMTHVEKHLQNRLRKKTSFHNNARSMIPLAEAQSLLQPNGLLLRDAYIAGRRRRTKESRGIIKMTCVMVVLSVGETDRCE